MAILTNIIINRFAAVVVGSGVAITESYVHTAISSVLLFP
jgi:hypothetical protein